MGELGDTPRSCSLRFGEIRFALRYSLCALLGCSVRWWFAAAGIEDDHEKEDEDDCGDADDGQRFALPPRNLIPPSRRSCTILHPAHSLSPLFS